MDNTSESTRRLSVVIPCYNEKEAIPAVLARWREVRPLFKQLGFADPELIVVDDASDDGSGELLKDARDLTWIRLPHRAGYGAALRTGFQAAHGDVIAFYDMDNTYDPSSLIDMIRKLDQTGAHLVCGDRLSQSSGMPVTRKIGNNLFVRTIQLLYRLKVYDSCTGLRVFRRELVDLFAAIPVNRLSYSLAMTLLCLKQRMKVVEVPIRYERRLGQSKLMVSLDGPLFLWMILSCWLFEPASLLEPVRVQSTQESLRRPL